MEQKKWLDFFRNVQQSLSFADFEVIFENAEAKPKHYWMQYNTTYRNNLLNFWNYLGKEKELFVRGLLKLDRKW